MTIDVSIIIPVFNAERTLQRTIYSTLNQGVAHEIIIVNDNSSDSSLSIAKGLQEKFTSIRIITLSKTSGASVARNRGIDAAKAEYIAFLDADDVWLPNKLSSQFKIINGNPKCSIVSCDALQVSPKGEVIRRGHTYKKPVSGENAWKTLLSYNFTPTPTIFTRTQLVRDIGGFDENLVISEDLDLWIALARKGELIVLPEVFVHYFDYSQSLMKRGIENSFSKTLNMIEKHIESDQRLTQEEIDQIRSARYLNIGLDALSSNQKADAQFYFSKAVKSGHPAWRIKNRLIKRKLKQFLGSFT